MKTSDKQLLIDYQCGKINYSFLLSEYSVNLRTDINYIKNTINEAIINDDAEYLQICIQLIWFYDDVSDLTDELNQLLIIRNHFNHQKIAKTLQDIKSSSSIPFVRQALESQFDYLEYTCNDVGGIAKWFSWLLFDIGTDEAVNLIKEYSNSDNEEIACEMRYRLSKVRQ